MILAMYHRLAAPRLLVVAIALWTTGLALAAVGQPAASGFLRLGGGPADEPVTAEAVFSEPRVAAGGPAAVAVTVKIGPAFHINPDAARSGPAWFPGQYPTTLSVVDPPRSRSWGTGPGTTPVRCGPRRG